MTAGKRGLTGGCLCGAIRYRLAGPPSHVDHCHCAMCRKAAGAPVVTWATIAAADFTVTKGEPAVYRSSERAERGFCGGCGSSLTFRYVAPSETEIDVAAGTLDEPEAVAPTRHVWTSSRLPWLDIADDLPRLAELSEG